jgi:hypothetical protein
MSTVEAVLTGRVKDFSEATGISVGGALQSDIRADYEKFELSAEKLKEATRRELCLRAAESIAWYWGVQGARRVVVVDFNSKAQPENEAGAWRIRDLNSVDTPLQRLFDKTGGNASPFGADGTDCDWWLGLTGTTQQAAAAKSTRPAILFFTDGPNSAGAYGHPVSGRSDENYRKQQVSMAEDFALEWQKASLNGTKSLLQLIALPGAQNEGLENIPQKVEARIDVWSERFRR